jgi:hypothetical protein
MELHSIVYHVCEILILAHIWDAFDFPCKIGCDRNADESPEFWPEPLPSMAKGRIASSRVFPGCFVRTEGIFVKNQNFQGPVGNCES